MKRLGVVAAVAVVAAALAGVATASPPVVDIGVPRVQGGSVLGQNLPLKAYASILPQVHLFGDPITAQVAVVADRKFVAPANVHVFVHFHPYKAAGPPTMTRSSNGRLLQLTWTWKLHCLTKQCLPETKTSDLARVFHLPPAHIEYLSPTGQVRYALNARFPRVATLSELSPSEVTAMERQTLIWANHLTPVASPQYRVSPNLLFWLTLALAGLLGAAGLVLVGRWAYQFRPARAAQTPLSSSSLERALTVFFWARAHDDETLQRKALERVADELPYDVHDLSETARALAWSEATPDEEEVQEISERAGISRRNGEPKP
ncbi:MAG TPA: hypothetical protein VKB43_05740 [Gaiellaceae bacterium]|nr:hypothetical protein [Gaiellaceae bacterium]